MKEFKQLVTVIVRKLLLSMFLVAISCVAACGQNPGLQMVDGPIAKCIDWYRKLSMEVVDSIGRGSEIKSFDDIGVVTIEIINQTDSIVHTERGNGIDEVAGTRKITFIISYKSSMEIRKRPPSMYFIYRNAPVLVYSGIEKYLVFDKNSINKLMKLVPTADKGYMAVGVNEYLVHVNYGSANDFSVTEYIPEHWR